MNALKFGTLICAAAGMIDLAAAAGPEMIEITPADNLIVPYGLGERQHAGRARAQKQLAAARSAAYKQAEKMRVAMQKYGYVIVDDSAIPDVERIRVRRSIEESDREVAYKHADLRRTRFEDGKQIRRTSLIGDDGRIHGFTHVYEFDHLGIVILEETSFSTLPNTRIRVSNNAGNITVNGYEGSFVVMQNADGSKSLTSLTWITDDKMYSLYVFAKVERETSDFYYMLDLANAAQ